MRLLRFVAPLFSVAVVYLAFWWVVPALPEPIGSRSDLFIDGATKTFGITLAAATLGLLIGLFFSTLSVTGNRALTSITEAYIWIIQGTPLLVQIFFFYFAVPKLAPWLNIEMWSAATWALAFNIGAYNTQAIRAGIAAVPKGQLEAAASLSLTRSQTLRWIVLPQALRLMTGPLTSNIVALLKDSALASSIGLLELSLTGSRITSETFEPVPVLLTVASFYLAMSSVLMVFSRTLPPRGLA